MLSIIGQSGRHNDCAAVWISLERVRVEPGINYPP